MVTVGGNVSCCSLLVGVYKNQRWAKQTLNHQFCYCEFILHKHLQKYAELHVKGDVAPIFNNKK